MTGDSTPYPIFPSFSEWTFPHDNLPPYWTKTSDAPPPFTRTYSVSQQTAAITARDRTCRLTNAVEGLEVAHIVPAREEAWFDSNSMGNYTMDVNAKASVGDGANMMLLRADVHSLYDKDKWTIVPKDTSLVFHLLSPSLELSRLYHNVPLQDNLNGVSMEYLLAAFARAIFPSLVPFLRNGVRRWLIAADVDGAQEVREYRAAELDMLYRLPGTRTPTPKRQQPQIQMRTRNEGAVDNGTSAPLRSSFSVSQKRPNAIFDLEDTTASSLEHENEPHRQCVKRFTSGTALVIPSANNLLPTPAATATHFTSTKSSHPAALKSCPSRTHIDTRAERHCFDELREAALQNERARSGTAATWQRETEWAKSAMAGSFSPEALKRWLWVRGNDNYMEEESGGDEVEPLSLDDAAYSCDRIGVAVD